MADSQPAASSKDQSVADVVVIGGGPGGYVAAIRAAQLGLKTVCVEMDKTLGGTASTSVASRPRQCCSRASITSSRGCTPGARARLRRMRLDLAQMLRRKDEVVGANTRGVEFLFRKNGVTWAAVRGRSSQERRRG